MRRLEILEKGTNKPTNGQMNKHSKMITSWTVDHNFKSSSYLMQTGRNFCLQKTSCDCRYKTPHCSVKIMHFYLSKSCFGFIAISNATYRNPRILTILLSQSDFRPSCSSQHIYSISNNQLGPMKYIDQHVYIKVPIRGGGGVGLHLQKWWIMWQKSQWLAEN